MALTNNRVEATYAHPSKSRSPINKRACTDIAFLAVFLVFVAILLFISIIAYINGDPRLLIYPIDSEGNRSAFPSLSYSWSVCLSV